MSQDSLTLPEMGGGLKNGADLEPAPQELGRSRARQDLKPVRQLKVPARAGQGRGHYAEAHGPAASAAAAEELDQLSTAATWELRSENAGVCSCFRIVCEVINFSLC
uniref:Uncharacterized protein n=1 Tax=Sphaerodactylus townsendi TaxID=933632 RepID=A0ACB8FEQ3_9SAUR